MQRWRVMSEPWRSIGKPGWEHAATETARRWALDLELSLGHYTVSQLMRTGKPGVPQSPRTERWGRL